MTHVGRPYVISTTLLTLAVLLGAGALVAQVGATKPTVTALAAESGPQVAVTFDPVHPVATRIAAGDAVPNVGTSPLRLTVVTARGGVLRRVSDGVGGGAVRFPATGSNGFALITNRGTTDAATLSPGRGDFSFGARFNLDDRSTSGSGDNGDNLMQRGLWGDSGQYKLEIDRGRVTCRVKGDAGAVQVTSSVAVQRQRWHRAQCARVGNKVSLSVGRPDGTVARSAATGPIGSVKMFASTKLTVGGKATAKGTVNVAASDQFNGIVDDIIYRRD